MEFKNINPNKLQDEFIKSGIIIKNGIYSDLILTDNECIAKNAWCEFEEGTDMTLVQQIVNVHNPTPIPKPLSQEEIQAKTLAQLTIENADLKQQLQTLAATVAQMQLK